MQPRFVVHGAGWGALVGWLSALLLLVVHLLDPAYGPGLLEGLTLVVTLPLFLGAPAGALTGAACGMGAAMAVGSCTDRQPARIRAALGAMALPVVVAFITRVPVLLLPALVGTALLFLSTPRIVEETALR